MFGTLGAGSGLLSYFTTIRESVGEMAELVSAIFAAINIIAIIWFTWTKNKPTIKKLDAEGDSEIVDAAQANLEGAKIVTTLLREQLDELRKELEIEKRARREAEEFLRQRIKELETEIQYYRSWSSRLVRQVVESGRIPEELDAKGKEDCKDDTSNPQKS